MLDLSVLFVNYNSWRVCLDALESIRAHPPRRADGQPLSFEVVVVDNLSPVRDAEAERRIRELLATLGGQMIMHHENGGYAKGMNLAYAKSRGRWVLVTNPDVVFMPGCIDALVAYAEAHPEVGATAPENFWDRGLQCRLPPNILPTLTDLWRATLVGISPRWVQRYSQRRTADAARVWQANAPVELDMLSGCCFVMARAFIAQIGLFDERFPLYYEDTDLSRRIVKAGKRIVQIPQAQLVHLYNRSAATNHGEAMARYWVSKRAYYRKWYGPLGALLSDACRWLLGTSWAKRRAARPPQPGLHELPASNERPTLVFPRAMARFVVEISLDPRFYLAGGVLGSGDRWSPTDLLFANFGPTTYYFRVCDLSHGTPELVSVWRYTRIYPPEWLLPAAPAPQTEPARDR